MLGSGLVVVVVVFFFFFSPPLRSTCRVFVGHFSIFHFFPFVFRESVYFFACLGSTTAALSDFCPFTFRALRSLWGNCEGFGRCLGSLASNPRSD